VLRVVAEREQQPADAGVRLPRSLLAVVLAPLVLAQGAGTRDAAIDPLLPCRRGVEGAGGTRQRRQVTARASASQWAWLPAVSSVAQCAHWSGRRSLRIREGMLSYSVAADRGSTGRSSRRQLGGVYAQPAHQSSGPRSSIGGSIVDECVSGISRVTNSAASRIHASRAANAVGRSPSISLTGPLGSSSAVRAA
jgi:hypothetical protein